MRKFVRTALVLSLLQSSLSSAADDWLNPPPADVSLNFIRAGQVIPARDVFEVPFTRFDVARYHHLENFAAVKLDCRKAEHLLHGHYDCIPGKDPYLIRAVYTNPGTGGFKVKLYDSDLLISHFSLGSVTQSGRVALIVNLPTEPKRVFITSSGAM